MLSSFKIWLIKLLKTVIPIRFYEYITKKYTSRIPSPPLVLAYHHFSDTPQEDNFYISKNAFEKQIKYFLDNGYEFLWQKEYDKFNHKTVIVSIDDGWMDNYMHMFPIIKKHNVKVTINLIAEKNLADKPKDLHFSINEINIMRESGLVSFESHSMTHPHLSKLSDEEIEFEVSESKKQIKNILNIDSNVFVCPFEDANQKVVEIISKHYKLGYNCLSNVNPLLSIKRAYIHEETSKKDLAFLAYDHFCSFYRKSK